MGAGHGDAVLDTSLLERLDLVFRELGLRPPAGLLREELEDYGVDGVSASRSMADAPLGRDVGAEFIVHEFGHFTEHPGKKVRMGKWISWERGARCGPEGFAMRLQIATPQVFGAA